MTPPPPPVHRLRPKTFRAWFAALVLSQAFLGFMGAGDQFALGHNGWNSSAYLQSARSTLRWGTLFPVQYYTGRTPPAVEDGYTHHPLGMHLHNTLAVWLFGDHEGSIRAVPAFFGVLALIALISVVRLLYDDRTALTAGGIWVLLPTNAIFTNMSNHENGFIFWMFLCGYAYLRLVRARFPVPSPSPSPSPVPAPSPASAPVLAPAPDSLSAKPEPWRRWYALTLVFFFWAAMWDWPAYYCALCFAVHWLTLLVGRYRSQDRARPKAARLRAVLPDLALLAGFSTLVVALFIGHFVLVRLVVGSLSELGGVFEARQVVGRTQILHHLKVVPVLMFTAPILLVAFGWFFQRAWQAVKGRFQRRDLIPFTFAIAGLLHYYIFRGTAVIHEFWGWTLTPFAAIAGAYVLFAVIDRLKPRLAARWPTRPRLAASLAIAVPTVLLLGNLAYRFVDLVPDGRAVGGSLWFVAHTRPVPETYQSTRPMIRFAAMVKDETTRRTGVMIDPAFERMWGYEPRFAITLDREVVTQALRAPPPERLGVTDGWVYIAPPQTLSDRRLVELAVMHPVMIYDDYVRVDLRRTGTEVVVYKSEPIDRDLWTWYWGGPWADALEPVRQPADEAALVQKVRDFRSANPR